MDELMLIENPRGGSRGLTYVPPFSYSKSGHRVHVPGHVRRLPGRNRGGKTMKNPVGTKALTQWFQGVDLMDAGAAFGGLASSTMLPGMFVKETVTTTQKLTKLGASLLAAVLAGMAFRYVSPTAGKWAVGGALAGTVQQALAMFTNVSIGRPMGRQIATSRVNRGGFRQTPGPGFTDPEMKTY